ncbi:C40 family peptidase [Rhodococcus sp. WMMA185]|uniref:C40 family peptidase n=1 Tax=Rhodococcus sp. WMMA185 TaxID=679318 RepID=UPI000877F0D8|nr:NlpC/P60 family protein [Rhodococcus sp. WMMA185]
MIPLDQLTRPIIDLLGALGTDIPATGGPADTLRASSEVIDAVHDTGRTAISSIHGAWQGSVGTAAITKTEEAQRSLIAVSDRGNELAAVVTEASELVRTGRLRLREILQSFMSLAVSAGPTVVTPSGQAMIIAAALDHLERAAAVVESVRAELREQTGALIALASAEDVPNAPSATMPACTGAASATAVSPASSGGASRVAAGMTPPQAMSPMLGLMRPVSSVLSPSGGGRWTHAVHGTSWGTARGPSSPDSSYSGDGVEVTLPDGSTALAPTREAAEAVRNALSQQGVPYVWGGTSPGVGLDCSGLTQWAYGEAGVSIPRLAQEQNVGMAVNPGDLMPGDLAVWDGHVAMVIGNGLLVEAGDPVQVGPIRTSTTGMAFYGFYRPT